MLGNPLPKRLVLPYGTTINICQLLNTLGEWPNGLRRCNSNERFLVQTPLGAQPSLGAQPRNDAPGDLRVETE